MKFSLKNFSLLLCVAGLLLAGCSKDSTEPEKETSRDVSFKDFSFQSASNSAISSNCRSYSGSGTIYITVPEDVALNSLVPSFSVNETSSVTMDGKAVQSGVTAVDFSKTEFIQKLLFNMPCCQHSVNG